MTCSSPGDFSAYTSGSSISLGTIAAGGSKVVKLSLDINANAPSGATITNTASASSATDAGSPRTASDSDTVATNAVLTITKSDGVTSVTAGTSTTYTITVGNSGPSDAQGVTLTDTWPRRTLRTRRARSPPDGSPVPRLANFSAWHLGQLDRLRHQPPAARRSSPSPCRPRRHRRPQANTVPSASSDDRCRTPSNSASDTDTVTSSADLSVTKSDGQTSVTAGDGVTYTYTITVTNGGPSTATGVSLADSWPASFTSSAKVCVVAGR